MPALPPYIPNKDANLNTWLLNFSTLASASPATYGLTSTDATNIAAAVAAWTAAYTPITSPSTKTASAVAAKNTAKVSTLGVIRPYAQTISLNAGVGSTDKIAIGVNPRTSTPSPITPPTTNPVLLLQYGGPLLLTCRYRDSAASTSVKAKPYGVTQCRVYGATSATVITDPTTLPQIATPTKSPFQLTFLTPQAGMTVYLAARWAIRTGQLGPWSSIIAATIPSA